MYILLLPFLKVYIIVQSPYIRICVIYLFNGMVFGQKWGASVQGDSPMYGATWFKEKSETHQKW